MFFSSGCPEKSLEIFHHLFTAKEKYPHEEPRHPHLRRRPRSRRFQRLLDVLGFDRPQQSGEGPRNAARRGAYADDDVLARQHLRPRLIWAKYPKN
jgi:hypothetical protein